MWGNFYSISFPDSDMLETSAGCNISGTLVLLLPLLFILLTYTFKGVYLLYFFHNQWDAHIAVICYPGFSLYLTEDFVCLIMRTNYVNVHVSLCKGYVFISFTRKSMHISPLLFTLLVLGRTNC